MASRVPGIDVSSNDNDDSVPLGNPRTLWDIKGFQVHISLSWRMSFFPEKADEILLTTVVVRDPFIGMTVKIIFIAFHD